jgi:hypothetical protein
LPSGPTSTVRVQWLPPVGRFSTMRLVEIGQEQDAPVGHAVAVPVALEEKDLALPGRAHQQVAGRREAQDARVLDPGRVGVDREARRELDALAQLRLGHGVAGEAREVDGHVAEREVVVAAGGSGRERDQERPRRPGERGMRPASRHPALKSHAARRRNDDAPAESPR